MITVSSATPPLATTTEVGTWAAPANRITWVPPFRVHSSRSYGETDVRILRVPSAFDARLPAEPAVFVASALMREAYLALLDEDEGTPRAGLLMEVAVAELARAPRDSLRLPEPKHARLVALTSLLRADPGNPATLAELGEQTGASERTLSRLFGSELSMSFHQWRTLLRVQHALLVLCEGASVTDTAMQLGWSNPSSFIEAFTASSARRRAATGSRPCVRGSGVQQHESLSFLGRGFMLTAIVARARYPAWKPSSPCRGNLGEETRRPQKMPETWMRRSR